MSGRIVLDIQSRTESKSFTDVLIVCETLQFYGPIGEVENNLSRRETYNLSLRKSVSGIQTPSRS